MPTQKILVVDGEAMITGAEAFVPALMDAFEVSGFEAERMVANAEAYHRLNLRWEGYKWNEDDEMREARLKVQADKVFNPDNVGLIVVRMGHTLGGSKDPAINAIVDPDSLLEDYYSPIRGGGRELIYEFSHVRDRDETVLAEISAIQDKGREPSEELWRKYEMPPNSAERHTITGLPIPWIIGVTAGQLEMDSRMAEEHDFVHAVYQQKLPGYNIRQPDASVFLDLEEAKVHVNPIRTLGKVSPHTETVSKIIDSAKQLLGDPVNALD